MYYFHNDYNQMCHEAVLNALTAYHKKPMLSYGEDTLCRKAEKLLCDICNDNALSVHFLVGGTQTNLTVIAAALRPHQAVIAAQSAHIHIHETGAIEAVGHKIISLSTVNGKITAEQICQVMDAHLSDESREHTAQPKMVYISNSTELGTIYSLSELKAISSACRHYGLYLFVDGARLGYALTAKDNDVTMQDLAQLSDVFYIGGTKVGAMFGEAVVIRNKYIAEDFRYLIKQHGGMLAKGWLLGLQFSALFENGLYWEIAGKANILADKLRDKFAQLGYEFYVPGTTNQIFPILPDNVLSDLSKDFTFSEQCRIDDNHRVVRFCTSWATEEQAVDALCDALDHIANDEFADRGDGID